MFLLNTKNSIKTCGCPEAFTNTAIFDKCGGKTSPGGQGRYSLKSHYELHYPITMDYLVSNSKPWTMTNDHSIEKINLTAGRHITTTSSDHAIYTACKHVMFKGSKNATSTGSTYVIPTTSNYVISASIQSVISTVQKHAINTANDNLVYTASNYVISRAM